MKVSTFSLGMSLIYANGIRKIPFNMELWQIRTPTNLSSIIRPTYHYGPVWWLEVFSLLNHKQKSQTFSRIIIIIIIKKKHISWDISVFNFSYSQNLNHRGWCLDVLITPYSCTSLHKKLHILVYENVISFLKRKLQVTVLAMARDYSPDQGYKLLDSFHPLAKCFICNIYNLVFTSTSSQDLRFSKECW